jgi:hypothetical protein
MITEDTLASFFERATRDLDPAVNDLITGAERRGRRLRIRRRIWLALGSGFVVVALAGTALVAGAALAHPQAGRLAAGARHPTPTHPVATHPTATHPTSTSSAGSNPPLGRGYRMSEGQMLHILRRLLPTGAILSNVNPYLAKEGSLEVDYNDGDGAVDLIIDVSPTATYGSSVLNCPKWWWTNDGPRPAGALPISCVVRRLPDGGIERDAVSYADAQSFYGYNIYDERPDGITVFLQVGNGINHTLPQVDRARPPGTMAGWERLAENPAWRLKKG